MIIVILIMNNDNRRGINMDPFLKTITLDEDART